MGIPLELITMAISALMTGLMSMKAQKDRQTLEALSAHQRGFQEAREAQNPFMQVTRRWVTLMTVFFVICFPKIVAVAWPEIGVTVGYHEVQPGFLFFTDDVEKVKWVTAGGLTITPLDSHLVAAIIGFYFGGKVGR